jgi:hypothetical protein
MLINREDNSTGEAVMGVYPYVLNYTTSGGEAHIKRGNITILK